MMASTKTMMAVVGYLAVNPGLEIWVDGPVVDGRPINNGRFAGSSRKYLPVKRASVAADTIWYMLRDGLLVISARDQGYTRTTRFALAAFKPQTGRRNREEG